MTGILYLNKLPKTKVIVSEMDWDARINSNFKMLLLPRECYEVANAFEVYLSEYEEYKYRVEGEGYLLTGKTEEDINKQVNRYKHRWYKDHPKEPVEYVFLNENFEIVNSF